MTSVIYDGILDEARKDAQKILSKARKEADLILKEAAERAERAREEERRATHDRLEALLLKEEGAQRSLQRQKELFASDAIWKEVEKGLNEYFEHYFTDPGCRATLVLWIAEAACGLGLKEAIVSFNAKCQVDEAMLRDAEALVEEKTGEKLSLSLAEAHIRDWGVVLSSPDGKVSYNNQLGVRMRRSARQIRKTVQEVALWAE